MPWTFLLVFLHRRDHSNIFAEIPFLLPDKCRDDVKTQAPKSWTLAGIIPNKVYVLHIDL